jgi:uroporphyrinogen decarboxylase
MTLISDLARSTRTRLALPVATFPGTTLTGLTVRNLVTNATHQAAAQVEFHRRYHTAAMMSCMDLSVEAEAFGATVVIADNEVPTVTGRLVTDESAATGLRVPPIGEKRTSVYLDAVRQLVSRSGGTPVIAGMIGPFSLAGRLFGVSEALLATAAEPQALEGLMEKVTGFLTAYAQEFRRAGASAVIIAEPTAGLLSPRGLAEFSSRFVQRIIAKVEDSRFEVILHNCGATALHLKAIAESGAHIFHFGAPMDIVSALEQLAPPTIVCGNLDPARVFVHSDPAGVARQTRELLAATAPFPNFVISSGCDIPAHAPLANIEAFFTEVAEAAHHQREQAS